MASAAAATRARIVQAALEAAELPQDAAWAARGDARHAVIALLCAGAVASRAVSQWLWRSGARRLSQDAAGLADTLAVAHAVWRAGSGCHAYEPPFFALSWLAAVVSEAGYSDDVVGAQHLLLLLGYSVATDDFGACWSFSAVLAACWVFRSRRRSDPLEWRTAVESLVMRSWKFAVLLAGAAMLDGACGAASMVEAFCAGLYCLATAAAPFAVMY